MIALVYTVTHAAGLLYQVITLNVAVNSYSNALLTLLVSNQFVEIKGAVFKKIEKQNLFQLTCADVVERFQLWLMLLIIAMRNMVEVGSLNISISSSLDSAATATAQPANIASNSLSLTGQVLGPFLMVLGSEMVVDWIKHAYIDKFNDTKPAIYSRFLDIMAADYYSNAFGDQNLTKRIGLPVLPLACLFIRTTIQTYHMFLATHLPLPLPSPATSLVNTHDPVGSEATASSTPGTVAALAHVDLLFRRALGRTGFPDDEGLSSGSLLGVGASSIGGWLARLASYTLDEAIALFLLLLICAVVFLVLVAAKLMLGLVLLRWARYRCAGMRERERTGVDVGSRRLGVNGMVEVPDEARRRIYEGDDAGLAKVKEKEDKARRDRERGRGLELGGVSRYAMVAKRIW
jgi:Eukaryotic membrane protein family